MLKLTEEELKIIQETYKKDPFFDSTLYFKNLHEKIKSLSTEEIDALETCGPPPFVHEISEKEEKIVSDAIKHAVKLLKKRAEFNTYDKEQLAKDLNDICTYYINNAFQIVTSPHDDKDE